MKLAHAGCVVVALFLIAVSPASAEPKGQGKEPAVEREVRHLAFDGADQAERFFDALNLLLDVRGKRPQLETVWVGDTVQIAGSPKLVRHVVALLGGDDKPSDERQRRRSMERRRGNDAAGMLHQLLAEVPEEPAKRREKREKTSRRERSADLEVRVFGLEFAAAPHVARFVEMLRVGTKASWAVEFDERTNSIIAKGPASLIAEAELLIHELDQPARNPHGEPAMKLMPLSHADAHKLCEVVTRAGRWSMMDVMAVADRRTNTIVLAGPKAQIREAAALIQKLDIEVKPLAAKQAPRERGDKKAGKKAKRQNEGRKKAKKNQAPPPPSPPTDA